MEWHSDFSPREVTIKTIIDKINNNTIDFDEIYEDPRFIDLCIARLYFNPIIGCFNKDYWDMYVGGGLIFSIKKYIIDNEPLSGLEIYPEYNNKTYNKLPRHIQRRIEETPIICYLTRKDKLSDNIVYYSNVLDSMEGIK